MDFKVSMEAETKLKNREKTGKNSNSLREG
jgi:hypothetical protein